MVGRGEARWWLGTARLVRAWYGRVFDKMREEVEG